MDYTSGMINQKTIVIGGLSYMGTMQNFAQNIVGINVEANSGIPFSAFIAGCLASIGYSILSGSHANTLGDKLKASIPTGTGAMIGSVLGLAIAGVGGNSAQMSALGAAVGAVYATA